jgi:hypothetical protein
VDWFTGLAEIPISRDQEPRFVDGKYDKWQEARV